VALLFLIGIVIAKSRSSFESHEVEESLNDLDWRLSSWMIKVSHRPIVDCMDDNLQLASRSFKSVASAGPKAGARRHKKVVTDFVVANCFPDCSKSFGQKIRFAICYPILRSLLLFCYQVFFDYVPSSATSLLSDPPPPVPPTHAREPQPRRRRHGLTPNAPNRLNCTTSIHLSHLPGLFCHHSPLRQAHTWSSLPQGLHLLQQPGLL